jgi:hypothetical protein
MLRKLASVLSLLPNNALLTVAYFSPLRARRGAAKCER